MADPEFLTTRQAAELVGRSMDSLKSSIHIGTLHAERVDGFWRIRRDVLLSWDARAPRPARRPKPPAYEGAAEALALYGSATPDELAKLLMVHVGNARKYLAILGNEGRAHRHANGEWFPGPDCGEQQEEAAS